METTVDQTEITTSKLEQLSALPLKKKIGSLMNIGEIKDYLKNK